jgi:AcrR family transcriptional regulator
VTDNDPHNLAVWTSPAELSGRLTAGFVSDSSPLTLAQSRTFTNDLRMRMAAASLATTRAELPSIEQVAAAVGVNERTVRRHFGHVVSLLAFPPPEFGRAIAECGAGAHTWPELLERIRPLFVGLEGNVEGRAFLAGLADVHHRHAELAQTDGYFASELKAAIGVDGVADPRVTALIGYLTEGLRSALLRWAQNPTGSLLDVHEMLSDLLMAAPPPD